MTEGKTEREYWSKFLGKQITLSKKTNNRDFFYTGVVVNVFGDKLILNDRKLGEIPISFDGLSVIGGGGK